MKYERKIFKSIKEIHEFIEREGTDKSIKDIMCNYPTLYNCDEKKYYYETEAGNYELILDEGAIESSLKELEFKTEYIEEKRKEAKVSYSRIAKNIKIDVSELKRIINNKQKCTLTYNQLCTVGYYINIYDIKDMLKL